MFPESGRRNPGGADETNKLVVSMHMQQPHLDSQGHYSNPKTAGIPNPTYR